MTLNLREWQQEAMHRFLRERRGIVKASTGSGKTIMAIATAMQLFDDHITVVIVPTKHLLEQWYEEFCKVVSSDIIARRGNGRKDGLTQMNIWTTDAARTALPSLKAARDLFIVIDECHRMGSPKNKVVLQSISPRYMLGLSATPERGDGISMKNIIGEIIYEYNFKDGIRDGHLNPVEVINIGYTMTPADQADWDNFTKRKKAIEKQLGVFSPSPMLLNKMKTDFRRYGPHEKAALCDEWQRVCQDRKRGIHAHRTRLNLTLDLIRKHAGDRKILVVGESIPAVEEMYEILVHDDECSARPVREHSQLSKWLREYSINEFKSNRASIMISARTLDQGADFPEVDCVIIHSSSSNVLQFIQRIGRGVRPAGADITLVYRPFTEGTSDALAIEKLIESDVLDVDCIKVIDTEGNPLVIQSRKELLRFTLRVGTSVTRKDTGVTLTAPEGLPAAIRQHKVKGGIFYWNPEDHMVSLSVDGNWIEVGTFNLTIFQETTEQPERNWRADNKKMLAFLQQHSKS